MLTQTNVYPSFFTAEESKEIMSEMVETIPPSFPPACFGVRINDQEKGKIELLPWTDLLLSIKQFIEDRLDIELDRAWLYSNLGKKKTYKIEDLIHENVIYNRSYVLLYFPAFTIVFRKRT